MIGNGNKGGGGGRGTSYVHGVDVPAGGGCAVLTGPFVSIRAIKSVLKARKLPTKRKGQSAENFEVKAKKFRKEQLERVDKAAAK